MHALRIPFLNLTLLILALLNVFQNVDGEGAECMQSGLGPKDMMMSNGEMNPKYMWGKSGGSVSLPIVLENAYSHKEKQVIFGGLAEMASKTCIKFYVYKHPQEVPGGSYVYITKTKSKGCWSYVGKQGGHQDLSLPPGCINHRTVMHEVMHAIGFSHEHVRADRDKYVKILWENIQRGRENNFQKKGESKSDEFGPYDYSSIMHYDNRAFSTNGRDTIRPTRGFARIGVDKRMSYWDAKKINRAYKCHNNKHKFGHSFDFDGFGGGHNSLDGPEESADPINFVPERQSYRPQNPFLAGPPSTNDIEHDGGPDGEAEDLGDYSPFPSYDGFYGGGRGDEDYYHP